MEGKGPSGAPPPPCVSTALGDAYVVDNYIWTDPPLPQVSLTIGLRTLESSLCCSICGGFFRAPVSTIPCHHTFCSECVRNCFKQRLKSLKRDIICPECRDPLPHIDINKCLVPNKKIEELVRNFTAIRQPLRDKLCQAFDGTSPTAQPNNKRERDEEEAPTKEQCPKRKRKQNVPYGDFVKDGEVPLVAGTDIDAVKMPAEVTRQKKRPTHYRLLKRKQLVDLCRKEGLSTEGKDEDLKKRHSDFITLYNSECDSDCPRSAQELARVITRREQARRAERRHDFLNGSHAHAKHMEELKQKRKAIGEGDAGAILSSGNSGFDAEMKNNFDKLIKQARNRQNIRKSKAQVDGDLDMAPSAQKPKAKENQSPTNLEVAHSRSASPKVAMDSLTHEQNEKEALPASPSLDSVAFPMAQSPDAVVAPVVTTPVPEGTDSDTAADTAAASMTPVPIVTNDRKTATASTVRPARKVKKQQAVLVSRSEEKWPCPKCTYINTAKKWSNVKMRCAVCGSDRPSNNILKNESRDTVVSIDC